MIKKGDELPKPLYYFAVVLIMSSIFGIGLLYSVINDKSFEIDFSIFVIVMIIIHSIVGIGIVSKKHWGFIIFKSYLYLLYLAIPVGTYIAHKTFCYIKDNELSRLYR